MVQAKQQHFEKRISVKLALLMQSKLSKPVTEKIWLFSKHFTFRKSSYAKKIELNGSNLDNYIYKQTPQSSQIIKCLLKKEQQRRRRVFSLKVRHKESVRIDQEAFPSYT